MFYFVIENTKINKRANGMTKNFTEMCRAYGWKVADCKCIYKCKV